MQRPPLAPPPLHAQQPPPLQQPQFQGMPQAVRPPMGPPPMGMAPPGMMPPPMAAAGPAPPRPFAPPPVMQPPPGQHGYPGGAPPQQPPMQAVRPPPPAAHPGYAAQSPPVSQPPVSQPPVSQPQPPMSQPQPPMSQPQPPTAQFAGMALNRPPPPQQLQPPQRQPPQQPPQQPPYSQLPPQQLHTQPPLQPPQLQPQIRPQTILPPPTSTAPPPTLQPHVQQPSPLPPTLPHQAQPPSTLSSPPPTAAASAAPAANLPPPPPAPGMGLGDGAPAAAGPASRSRRRQYPEMQAAANSYAGGPPPTGPPGYAASGPSTLPPRGPQPPGLHAAPPTQPPPVHPGMAPPLTGSTLPPPMSGQPMPPPAPGQAGTATNMSQQGQRRGIDPDSVPSPVRVMKDDQTRYPATQPFVMASRANPPLASTRVRIIDEGNASSRVIRPLLNVLPATKELAALSQVPVALVVRPLADVGPGELPVPLVEHPGGEGPIRCSRCKAYISHLAVFADGGRRYICPFCQHANAVPDAYFCNLDHYGRRHDLAERPELVRGSVEYPAPATYCARPPQVPALLFLVDVSYNAVQSGLVSAAMQAIRATIEQHEASRPGQLLRMGIITFDTAVHFYNLTETLAQPQMLVVSDVDDMFTPLQKGLVVDGVKSKEVVNVLLEHIPKQFASNRTVDVAFGAASRAAMIAIKDMGGRIFAFLSTLPSAGPGTLQKREDPALLGTDGEMALLAEKEKYYALAAKDCVKYGISFDLFVAPNAFVDLASLAPLANHTGGSLTRYPYFRAYTHGQQLVGDVLNAALRNFGVEAMLRVRSSEGLTATGFYGALHMENTRDVELAGIDSTKALVVRFDYDTKLPEGKDSAFQVALLYTNRLGERRLRVHTLSLRTSSVLADIFRGADMDAVLTAMPKMLVSDVPKVPLGQLRGKITAKTVGILSCYRKHCTSSSTSTGQLILPEALKLLPVYMNCVLRSDAFRKGGDMGADQRVQHLHWVLTMAPEDAVAYYYPRVLPLHTIEENDTELPEALRTGGRNVREDGVYLIENGRDMILFIGQHCPAQWIQQVLGKENFAAIEPLNGQLPVLQSPLNAAVRRMLDIVRQERGRFMPLLIIKQRDPTEVQFRRLLVEDKFNESLSYVEYLCLVHKEIQTATSS